VKEFVRRHRKPLLVAAQVLAVVVFVGALVWAAGDAWGDAGPRLRHADLGDVAISCALLAGYYMLFVIGWMWILAAFGIRLPYRIALGAEMASMLAKYVPGGVWTPAARVVAVRRYGVKDTPLVLASIALEAGLSAIAGVLVFVLSLPFIDDVDAPLLPLGIFAAVALVLLHPRVFVPLCARVYRPFGEARIPALRYRTMLGLIAFYAAGWVLGGAALLYLLRSVGSDPGIETIAFLGGTSAIGAIVAVLSVIAPSGLGVREGSMYGLLLAVSPAGAALGATILNRLTITIVELLLLAGAVLWRVHRPPLPAEPDGPVPDPTAS
jgi:glycosyltransferase 2 family protein